MLWAIPVAIIDLHTLHVRRVLYQAAPDLKTRFSLSYNNQCKELAESMGTRRYAYEPRMGTIFLLKDLIPEASSMDAMFE